MKVLLIHDYGTRSGGAEHMSLAFRAGLRTRGHEARLFTSRARPLPLPVEADDTCYGTMRPFRRLLQAANPDAFLRLRAVLRTFRPDVVHVRMFMTQLSPLILPLLRGVPSLLHVVNYDLICPLNTKILPDGAACNQPAGAACHRSGCLSTGGLLRASAQRRLWRRWSDVFDLIVANSDWVRARLVREGIAVTETLWNGVPVRPARPPLDGPPHIGFAGRLYAKKGVDVLVRALATITAELPAARLLLAGDGPDRARLEALTATLGLAERVTWLGHVTRERLEEAFAGVWVQAVPSLWDEPFGLVAAEAMMRGTAVVASRSGGLSEQIVDEVTGFTVPPGDAEALAAALLRVLRSRETAEQLGAAGRQRAVTHLSEEQVITRLLALYRRLLA